MDIENVTGIKVCTIQCVQRLWLSMGRVIKRPLEEGCQRILTSLEVNVSDYSLIASFLMCYLYSILRAL